MWSPLSSSLANSLYWCFVIGEDSETLDQLTMAWMVWNWFTMSMKTRYFPWRRKDRIRPRHGAPA